MFCSDSLADGIVIGITQYYCALCLYTYRRNIRTQTAFVCCLNEYTSKANMYYQQNHVRYIHFPSVPQFRILYTSQSFMITHSRAEQRGVTSTRSFHTNSIYILVSFILSFECSSGRTCVHASFSTQR